MLRKKKKKKQPFEKYVVYLFTNEKKNLIRFDSYKGVICLNSRLIEHASCHELEGINLLILLLGALSIDLAFIIVRSSTVQSIGRTTVHQCYLNCGWKLVFAFKR